MGWPGSLPPSVVIDNSVCVDASVCCGSHGDIVTCMGSWFVLVFLRPFLESLRVRARSGFQNSFSSMAMWINLMDMFSYVFINFEQNS